MQRAVERRQPGGDVDLQRVEQLCGILDALGLDLGAQGVEQSRGGRHTDVGTQQPLFEIVPGLLVDTCAGHHRAEVAREEPAGLVEPIAERGALDGRVDQRGLGDDRLDAIRNDVGTGRRLGRNARGVDIARRAPGGDIARGADRCRLDGHAAIATTRDDERGAGGERQRDEDEDDHDHHVGRSLPGCDREAPIPTGADLSGSTCRG